ncbi:MAG: ATP-binding protein [Hylemonella sp.]|nr:ATP-binding protein [Hylemonella sp.]
MGRIQTLQRMLLARFLQLDLRGKITLALLSGALALGALTTLTSYLMFREQLSSHTEALLDSYARQEQREIELRLGGLLTQAESLATNAVTANALADSRGRETYLDPLLRSQKLGVVMADITVVDYRGRPVASTQASAAPDVSQDESFLAMMSRGETILRVDAPGEPTARLLLAMPIRYRLTNNVEGGVILRLPLASLLSGQSEYVLRIDDVDGRRLVGEAAPAGAFERARSLQLPAPMEKMTWQVVLAKDRGVVFRALDTLLLVFLGLGVFVVLVVVLFAHAGARFIARPLGELAAAAEGIAASGRPEAWLPVRSSDEFGRLSAAFNTMVDRLRDSYAELEQRVVERTQELEQSRREAERAGQLLREAVHSIAVGFSIYDPEDRLVMCNEAYLHIYASNRDGIVPGASFEDIVRQGAARGFFADATGRIDDWVTQRLVQHRQAQGVAIEQRLADGRWLLLIEHRTPSGFIVGNVIDITERHAAEARIRDRTEQLNAIFALSPDAFVSFDAQRRVKYVSPAFKRMTGLDETGVVGLDEDAFSGRLAAECSTQAPFAGVAALRAAQAQPVKPGMGSRPRQLIEVMATGRRMLEVGVRLSDAETVSQILYLRDVTHETEVDRMKSEFLSTAAHELRTPMASIYGFSELLMSGRLAEAKKQESVSAIYRQSKLMISIVNELLDLARIDARGGKDFDFQPLDLDELLAETLSNFKAPEGRAGPLLRPGRDIPKVKADRLKLMQAIGNVLSNAYKYSPEGGEVSVTVVNAPASDGMAPRVGICVQDQGIGMLPEQLARVSERFYRADASGRIPGTGLGMSIVKEIIELHEGEMALSSEPGRGTTVTLWLNAA